MNTQQDLVEKLLFDYYLVSSRWEAQVVSARPYYLAHDLYTEMVTAAHTLDGLVRRVLQDYLRGQIGINLCVETFPCQKQVLGLNLPLTPFFWARYDAFVRPEGGFFFCEFNYDKPCAQREILFNNLIAPTGNPNEDFAEQFVAGIEMALHDWGGHTTPKAVVGIMIDPNHYEELHLAYLYQDILTKAGYQCVLGGAANFQVVEDRAMVFGQAVDVILRQYPTEHGDEIPVWVQLLRLYEEKKLLLMNDPRAILAQGKGLFATLWELLEQEDYLLSTAEQKAIRNYLPRTWIYARERRLELETNKDRWVLKANYSRYSEDVYLGCQHTDQEWHQVLDYVVESGRVFIMQEFCSSAPLVVPRYVGQRYVDTSAYGNFGIYLTMGQSSGITVRWNDNYVTSDLSWFSSVGVIPQRMKLDHRLTVSQQRKQLWRRVCDEAAEAFDYTGGYTGHQEAFTVSVVQLSAELVEELYRASEGLLQVFTQGLELVVAQRDILGPVLGIEAQLLPVVCQRFTQSLGLLGRFDWILNEQGEPKLLEYNPETPAGLVESVGLNQLVAKLGEEYHLDLGRDPNQDLPKLIKTEYRRIIKDYSRQKQISRVGWVTSTYYEDWDHTNFLASMLQDDGIQSVVGEVSGLEVRQGQLYLYQQPLDAVYRYYPLDWWGTEQRAIVQALGSATPSINPLHTFVLQSKAFFALIWELGQRGFFTAEEFQLIRQYVPLTSLSPGVMPGEFVVKPYYQREGQGVKFSPELTRREIQRLAQEQVVFQERVHSSQINLQRSNGYGDQWIAAYPVFGVFTVHDRARGIYTRAGSVVTGKEAVYVPTFVKG